MSESGKGLSRTRRDYFSPVFLHGHAVAADNLARTVRVSTFSNHRSWADLCCVQMRRKGNVKARRADDDIEFSLLAISAYYALLRKVEDFLRHAFDVFDASQR